MAEIVNKNYLCNSTEDNLENILKVAFSNEISSGQLLDDSKILQKIHEITKTKNESIKNSNVLPQLLRFCSEGNYDSVKDCIINRCNVNEIGPGGETALTCAININNVQIVELLLKSGANPNSLLDKIGSTPLMDACNVGYTDIVRLLFEFGATSDIKSTSNNTALHYAACGGHLDCCQLIFDYCTNLQALIEEQNENGHTALMEAATSGFLETTKYIVENGANINTPSIEFKETALTLASYKGYSEILQYLLESGADPEHRTDEMHTGLMEASMEGHLEAVKVLLYYGACINMRSDSFESPLTLATCGGHIDVAAYLIRYGANIEEVNDESYTPLMEAAREGHLETVAMLLALGANINQITEETQETAMTLAACGGFNDIVLLLYRCGADIELGSSSPLMESSQEGHLEVVKALLNMGAKVDTKNSSDETSLHFSAENGHTEVCKYLLDHNANIHHVSEGGRTCLMKACKAGNLDVVILLLDKGARRDQMTTAGDHNALSLACANGHYKVVEYLLQMGADPTIKLKDNYTALIEASRAGHIDVIEILLRKNNRDEQLLSSTIGNNNLIYPSESLDNNIRSDNQAHLSCELSTKSNFTPVNIYKDVYDTNKLMDVMQDIGVQPPLNKGFCNYSSLRNLSNDSSFEQLSSVKSSYLSDSLNTKTPMLAQSLILPTKLPEPPVNTLPSSLNFQQKLLYSTLSKRNNLSSSIADEDYDKLFQDVIDINSQNIDQWVKYISPNLTDNTQVTKSKLSESTLSCVTTPQVPEHETSPKNHFLRTIKKAKHSENYNNQLELEIADNNSISHQIKKDFRSDKLNNLDMEYLVSCKFHRCYMKDDVGHRPECKDGVNHRCEQCDKFHLKNNSMDNFKNTYTLKKTVFPTSGHVFLSNHANDSCTSPTDSGVFSADTSNINDLTIPNSLYDEYQTDIKRIFNSVTSTRNNSFIPKISNATLSSTPYQKQVLQPKRRLQQRSAKTNNSSMSTWPSLYAEPKVAMQRRTSPLKDKFICLRKISDNKSDYIINSPLDSNNRYESVCRKPLSLEDDDQFLQQPYFKVNHNIEPLYVYPLKDECKIKEDKLTSDFHLESAASLNNNIENDESCSVHSLANITIKDDYNKDNIGIVNEIGNKDDDEDTAQHAVTEISNSLHNYNLKSKGCNKTCLKKLNVNVCTESLQESPLSLACSGGHIEVVKLLIDSGAKLEHRDKKSQTALHAAVLSGHLEVTKLLLESGADKEAVVDRTKDTALSIACANGKLNIVEELVKAGANIEHRNVSDYTPLCLAASGGFIHIIKFLLKNNIDINSITNSKLGISPLMLAAMNGHVEAVNVLLDNGSDINAEIETNKNTALTLACFQGRANVVSLLVDKKAYIEHKAKSGLTPLMEAASQGHVNVGRILINAGADVNSPPVLISRDTALTIAAEKGHTKFVRLLIEHNAIVEHRNKKGVTPLWLASHGGYIDIVKILIEAIADTNSSDSRRITCLMAAFKRGHILVVNELVKYATQFPSEYDCVKYTKSIKNEDKDLIKKCESCKEIILKTKERQEFEAAKNAKDLLKQVELEKKAKEQKEMKQAKKREKKKAKKKAKQDGDHISDNQIVNSVALSSQYTELISLNNDENTNLNNIPHKLKEPLSIKKESLNKKTKVELNNHNNCTNDIVISSSKVESSAPIDINNETVLSPTISFHDDNIGPTTNNNKINSWNQINSNKIIYSTKLEEASANWQKIGNNKKKIDIQINKKDIGKVIGQGGSVVNSIRQITGVHIDIDSLANDLEERTVHMRGNLEAITKARDYIYYLVDGSITGTAVIKESEPFISKCTLIDKETSEHTITNTGIDLDYSKVINPKSISIARQNEKGNKSSNMKYEVPLTISANNLQYGFSKSVKNPDLVSVTVTDVISALSFPELESRGITLSNNESTSDNVLSLSAVNIDLYSSSQYVATKSTINVNPPGLNHNQKSRYMDGSLEVNISISQPSNPQNIISKSFPLAPGSERSLYLRTYNSTPENSPQIDCNHKNELISSDSTVSDKDDSNDSSNFNRFNSNDKHIPSMGNIMYNTWSSNDYGKGLQDHASFCEPFSILDLEGMTNYPKLPSLNPKAESFSPSFETNSNNSLYNLKPDDFYYNNNGTLTLNPTTNTFNPRQQSPYNIGVIPTLTPLKSSAENIDNFSKPSNMLYTTSLATPPQEERLIRLQDYIYMAINIFLKTNGYDHNMAEAAFLSFMRSANLDLNTRMTTAEFTSLINNIINQSDSPSSLPQSTSTLNFLPPQSLYENMSRILSTENHSPFRIINQPLTTPQAYWPAMITNLSSQSIWAPCPNNGELLTYFSNLNQCVSAQAAFNSPLSLPLSSDTQGSYFPQTFPQSYDMADCVTDKYVLSNDS